MLAFPITFDSAYLRLLPISPTVYSSSSRSSAPTSTSNYHSMISYRSLCRLGSPCFCSDSSQLDEDKGYHGNCVEVENFSLDEETESPSNGGVYLEIEKLGKNSRRIRSKIGIAATLEAVWSVLTDYEKLSEFLPGLSVSQLVEKSGNCARLYQIGEQNLAFGLKFNAKGLLDCYEKDLEILPRGRRREIEFNMVEGDFQLFEGKWSIEQTELGINNESDSDSYDGKSCTTLSYIVDVEPKLWLPVRLVEGRLCKEIETNLTCLREEVLRVIQRTIPDI